MLSPTCQGIRSGSKLWPFLDILTVFSFPPELHEFSLCKAMSKLVLLAFKVLPNFTRKIMEDSESGAYRYQWSPFEYPSLDLQGWLKSSYWICRTGLWNKPEYHSSRSCILAESLLSIDISFHLMTWNTRAKNHRQDFCKLLLFHLEQCIWALRTILYL